MKKSLAVLTISSLLFSTQAGWDGQVHAEGTPLLKSPTQETQWYSSGKSPQQEPENIVGFYNDPTIGHSVSALQFDLRNVTSPVSKAILRIRVTTVDNNNGITPTVAVVGSTDDNWDDNDMMPPINDTDQEIISPVPVTLGTMDQPWMEFDVTNFINDQLGSDKIVTLVLKGEEVTPGVDFYYMTSSYTFTPNPPQLELQLAPPAPPTPAHAPTVTPATTNEDLKNTSGLVVTPADADGTAVQYYKISEIQGGRVYLLNGTEVTDGMFIPASEGTQGLKFLPSPDANSESGDIFSFNVRAAKDQNGTGLSDPAQAVITVQAVNDNPIAVNDTLPDMEEDTAPRLIPFSKLLENDKAGPANESGQQLTVTPLPNTAQGGTITVQGSGVLFTPTPNYNGPAGFQYKLKDDGIPESAEQTAQVSWSITSVADAPTITNAFTAEDTKTGSGLKISPSPYDGTDVQYFKIGEIKGGTLLDNSETYELKQGNFISRADGDAGLKFKPSKDANSPAGDTFSVEVQASLDHQGTGLSAPVIGYITVSEVNDPPVAQDDNLGNLAEGSPQQSIPVEKLLENDNTGADNEQGEKLTVVSVSNPVGGNAVLDESKTHVLFTPGPNFRGTASFKYTITDDGTTNGIVTPETATATASYTIQGRADLPVITPASTDEDTMTSSGLEITPTNAGGSTTNYFKITDIQGGTLYQHNGTTMIHNGDYITIAEGMSGLRFMPSPDAHGSSGFGFTVQAAPSEDNEALLSDSVPVNIEVNEVNDAPVAQDDSLPSIPRGSQKFTIPASKLLANDIAGPVDEQSKQNLSIVSLGVAVGGTASLVNGDIEFEPAPDFTGTAKFTYTVSDGIDTGSAEVSFDITALPPSLTLQGELEMYLLQGQAYQEPGYSASGDTDGDITGDVAVNGMVDSNTLGTYQLHYNVSDSANVPAAEQIRTVHVVSDELTALSARIDGLTPAFQPEQEAYKLQVANQVATLNLTAQLEDPTATLTVNGASAESGAEKPITLKEGKNDITLVVTARGGATKTYTVEVTRDATPSVPPVENNGGTNGDSNGGDSGSGGSGNGGSGNGGSGNGGSGNGGSGSADSSSGGNSSSGASTGSTSTTTDSTASTGASQTRQAKVVTSSANSQVVQVPITRMVESGGKTIDSVTLNSAKVDEILAKAAAGSVKAAQIVIDDLPDQPADEVKVGIAHDSLLKLQKAQLGLVIEASGARVTLPADSLSGLTGSNQDLYFRVVPIRKADETRQVEERVLDTKELKDYAQGSHVQAVGQPMTIETNYANQKTKVMFPLTGVNLPSDPQERQQFLSGLGVFIEHSDGEKEVEQGDIVYDAEGTPVGIEIEVQKFSTFTIISTESSLKTYLHYISGYPDGTFRPSAEVTRAEMAALISRQLADSQAASAGSYSDVAQSHWAAKAILQLTAAGILTGDGSGHFRPDASLTRAEMAVIAAKLKNLKLDGSGAASAAEGQSSWAASAIAAVQSAGLMVGFPDGSFHPNDTLTRAEAVAVLNRLFDRPALKIEAKQAWPDVKPSYWAASAIESASRDLQVNADRSITAADSDKQGK
ncbi:hypothetical protein DCC85_21770 [Paenibacillus sp. CAA11]|uniref:cadherin-like domain-containing protein n=1 Tax=Paenibacillus sp. CAA11 TaxID=1532905 RepID=UPI000D37D06A|nr:Ig-like domain-containing protein [Paenibacillus sp. CAA11]AWB46536.1 hypothetical protein DCC85_21770 [Paenibacillus sp. CAA11]